MQTPLLESSITDTRQVQEMDEMESIPAEAVAAASLRPKLFRGINEFPIASLMCNRQVFSVTLLNKKLISR